MDINKLVKQWFQIWEEGNFRDLPIAEEFIHTSPYGVMKGKKQYISIVEANKDKFLGHKFEIRDEVYEGRKASVRYAAIQNGFTLEVSEWLYEEKGLIKEIISYYHVGGEIKGESKLADPQNRSVDQ